MCIHGLHGTTKQPPRGGAGYPTNVSNQGCSARCDLCDLYAVRGVVTWVVRLTNTPAASARPSRQLSPELTSLGGRGQWCRVWAGNHTYAVPGVKRPGLGLVKHRAVTAADAVAVRRTNASALLKPTVRRNGTP
jgi:hypothetical protein